VQIVALKTLRQFWAEHPEAERLMRAWYATARKATWASPADVRKTFNSADFIADNRVIFDIGGNRYRLIARISYPYKVILIKFVGTHKDYDQIDPETV